MAEPSDYKPPRLRVPLIVLVLVASDMLLGYWIGIGYGLYKEVVKMMLPTFGAAVIAQAASMLIFLVGAIWTGELPTIAFAWWQFVFVVQCATYTWIYGPKMAGALVGAVLSACLAGNVWTSLHNWVKAETMKKMAVTADTITTGLSKLNIDDCDDTLEKADWTVDDSSSSATSEIVSWRDWFARFAMISYFSAGCLAFFFAFLTGTLKITLSTFGLGFMGMIIVALVLLDLARTSEARRLAIHCKTANVVSSAIALVVGIFLWQRDGVNNAGMMCVVHWAACLNAGIAEVLLQSSLDKDPGEEENNSENSDEDWVHMG
jgi:hypothetical protein